MYLLNVRNTGRNNFVFNFFGFSHAFRNQYPDFFLFLFFPQPDLFLSGSGSRTTFRYGIKIGQLLNFNQHLLLTSVYCFTRFNDVKLLLVFCTWEKN